MKLVDVLMRLLLLLEQFLADGLTGIVEQAVDVVVAAADESMIVAIVMLMMMCMDVKAAVVDENNIAV